MAVALFLKSGFEIVVGPLLVVNNGAKTYVFHYVISTHLKCLQIKELGSQGVGCQSHISSHDFLSFS